MVSIRYVLSSGVSGSCFSLKAHLSNSVHNVKSRDRRCNHLARGLGLRTTRASSTDSSQRSCSTVSLIQRGVGGSSTSKPTRMGLRTPWNSPGASTFGRLSLSTVFLSDSGQWGVRFVFGWRSRALLAICAIRRRLQAGGRISFSAQWEEYADLKNSRVRSANLK